MGSFLLVSWAEGVVGRAFPPACINTGERRTSGRIPNGYLPLVGLNVGCQHIVERGDRHFLGLLRQRYLGKVQ